MSNHKTLLTDELKTRFINKLREGNYIETSAAIVGVSKMTIYNWLKRGARELRSRESGNRAKSSEKKFVDFLQEVEKAQAEAEAMMLQVINKAAVENWQAAAWKLERKYPAKWGRQDRVIELPEVQDEQRDIERADEELLKDEESAEHIEALYRRQRQLQQGED